MDHPFVASLYGTIQTGTHLHFLMEYCEGGELYGLLTTQPTKRLKETHMRFYVAEVRVSQPSCLVYFVYLMHTFHSKWGAHDSQDVASKRGPPHSDMRQQLIMAI